VLPNFSGSADIHLDGALEHVRVPRICNATIAWMTIGCLPTNADGPGRPLPARECYGNSSRRRSPRTAAIPTAQARISRSRAKPLNRRAACWEGVVSRARRSLHTIDVMYNIQLLSISIIHFRLIGRSRGPMRRIPRARQNFAAFVHAIHTIKQNDLSHR